MDLFCVLKKELDAKKLHQKKSWMWCCSYFIKHTERDGDRFRSIEQWQFFKPGAGISCPMMYLDQDHISSSSTSLWKCWCVWVSHSCQTLPSADSFLVFCQFVFLPRKCSIAILMLHFGQLWQAASGIWRQNTDYPKHWILSTFSVKNFTIEPWCDLFVCNTVRRTTLS